jgi:hypothetical protein
VGDFIDSYRQVTTQAQWVAEIGTNDLNLQAEYLQRFYQAMVNQFGDVVERVYWFCYADGMVPPFGLVDDNQQPKPAYDAYQAVAIGPVPPPPVKTYAVEYIAHNTPTDMVIGRTAAVQISLRNTGNWTWPAGGDHPVRLGYHWYTQDGQDVPSDLWDDNRAALPFDLPPGQSVTLDANLGPPRLSGSFEVRWDMVEELRTWFVWQQTPTLNVLVEVTTGLPEPTEWQLSASHNNVHTGADNLQQAIDGDASTRWSTFARQQPGMWFKIDLGEVQTVNQVRLDNKTSPMDYPRGYIVQLSTEGHNWTTVAEDPNNERPLAVAFSPRPARYVRIEQTGSSDRWWWSIHEVEIKSDGLSMSATASHHNVFTGGDNVLHAFDGRLDTRWSSHALQQAGMWFEIDLNETRVVSGLQLDTAGSPHDYPRGYVVRVSLDRQQWVEVARNPNNDRELDITFTSRSARYIRIEQTGSSEHWWWSIHEIAVKSGGGEMSATASHNNTLVGSDNLTQALDALPNTRWSSRALQRPGMWFEIDLGETRLIKGLVLDNSQSPQDYPRGYVVLVSEDRSNWREVARRANNDRLLDVTFASRSVRYIRIEQTGSSEHWWWSIHRIAIRR